VRGYDRSNMVFRWLLCALLAVICKRAPPRTVRADATQRMPMQRRQGRLAMAPDGRLDGEGVCAA